MNQKDDGGPAFPGGSNQDAEFAREYSCPMNDGMSLRDYACIHLRIPESGKDWLDELIRKSQADWFAGQALVGQIASSSDPEFLKAKLARAAQKGVTLHVMEAEGACKMADAMLEARKQNETTELQQLCSEIMEDDWGYLSVSLQNKIRQGAEARKQ